MGIFAMHIILSTWQQRSYYQTSIIRLLEPLLWKTLQVFISLVITIYQYLRKRSWLCHSPSHSHRSIPFSQPTFTITNDHMLFGRHCRPYHCRKRKRSTNHKTCYYRTRIKSSKSSLLIPGVRTFVRRRLNVVRRSRPPSVSHPFTAATANKPTSSLLS